MMKQQRIVFVTGMSGGGGRDCTAGIACTSDDDCDPALACAAGVCGAP